MERLPTIQNAIRELIRKTLERYRGDITKSALSLGISRGTLYRHIQNYHINLADLRKGPDCHLPVGFSNTGYDG